MRSRPQRRPRPAGLDPLEASIELALAPGSFIRYGASWDFVSDLEGVAAEIEKVAAKDPSRRVQLFETFLAGCHEKAEEIDDSSGSFGTFVEGLFGRWMRARQDSGADPDETARLVLARMDDDPYGFASHLERVAAEVMDSDALSAFEVQVRARLDATPAEGKTAYARRRWAEVLRVIYARRRNVSAYVALCEATETTPQDCAAIATILRARRKPNDALAWVERGLELAKKDTRSSFADHDLRKMKRDLLAKTGRADQALADAWTEFQEHPSIYTYRDFMGFVPKAKRAAWQEKAMEAIDGSTDLDSLIELWLETKETERLVARLRRTRDAELEDLSHYRGEPAAKHVEKAHPEVAARVYRALGMRILNAKKSRYYDAALGNFENARRCYDQAGLGREWNKVVAAVRAHHSRKTSFIGGFERLVAGQRPSAAPTFLERARSRWEKGTST